MVTYQNSDTINFLAVLANDLFVCKTVPHIESLGQLQCAIVQQGMYVKRFGEIKTPRNNKNKNYSSIIANL